MEGTNKAHENGEAMGLVGVRLTAQLGTTSFLKSSTSSLNCFKNSLHACRRKHRTLPRVECLFGCCCRYK